MNNIDITDYIERTKVTEEELDALYTYLALELEGMGDEERAMWADILDKIDPDE